MLRKVRILFVGKDNSVFEILEKAVKKNLKSEKYELLREQTFNKAITTIPDEGIDIVLYEKKFITPARFKKFYNYFHDRKTLIHILLVDSMDLSNKNNQIHQNFIDDIVYIPDILKKTEFQETLQKAVKKCQIFSEYYLSESRFAQLINDIHDLIYQIDAQGNIVYVNQKGMANLGYEVSEILGKGFLSLVDSQCQNKFLEGLEKLITSSEPIVDLEVKMAHKNGEDCFMLHNIYIVRDNRGIPVLIHGLGRDTTQTRRYRDQLLERNIEVETFLQAVVHDLRNPLTSILGFLTLIQNNDSNQLSNSVLGYISRIQNNAERIEMLLNDLSKLSNGESSVYNDEYIIYEEILLEVIGCLREKIYECNAKINISGGENSFFMDRHRLIQLFDNLIGNALKYRSNQRELEIEIGFKKNPKDWDLFIQDNGLGIPENELDKILLPFYRGSNGRRDIAGSGVGLAIVRKIIEHYEGEINIQSEINKGTLITMKFPLSLMERKRGE